MSNTNLALLEVANWLAFGEVKVEVARAMRHFLTDTEGSTFCDLSDPDVLVMPDNQGGAWLIRRLSFSQVSFHFRSDGSLHCQQRIMGALVYATECA